jgi:hypothetical protein
MGEREDQKDAVITEIIIGLRVIARYNEQANDVITVFEEQGGIIKPDDLPPLETGETAYGVLVKVYPKIANAVHDFVYEFTNPHNGIVTKNLAREHVSRNILGL